MDKKFRFFLAFLLILLLSFLFLTSKRSTGWKDIDLISERVFIYSTNVYSEKDLKNLPNIAQKLNPESLGIISKIMFEKQSPYPLEIIKSQWKIIDKKPFWKTLLQEPDQIEWGYQIVLDNVLEKDSICVVFHSIDVELQDEDGFTIKERNKSFIDLNLNLFLNRNENWIQQFDTLKTWKSKDIYRYLFYTGKSYSFDLHQKEFLLRGCLKSS